MNIPKPMKMPEIKVNKNIILLLVEPLLHKIANRIDERTNGISKESRRIHRVNKVDGVIAKSIEAIKATEIV
jgi:hypothetical protein